MSGQSHADIRVSQGFLDHPKTKKLARRCGPTAPLNLLRLWCWVAANHYDGDLAGMTPEDIAIASGWEGSPDEWVGALVELRWLDAVPCDQSCKDSCKDSCEDPATSFAVHDWKFHQQYLAATDLRREKARKMNEIRWAKEGARIDRKLLEAKGSSSKHPRRSPARNPSDIHAGSSTSSSAPTSTTPPRGVDGGEAAASRPTSPVPGSAATPPRSGSDAATPGPVVVCVDCRKAPPAPGRSICASCSAPKVATPFDAAAMLKAALVGRKAVTA